MFGGTIDEAGNCLDMTQEELMNFACPMLGGTMNGETCDAFQPVNGTYTLTNDQFCITTLDPETGLEGEECGTLVYNENGFVVTYIYPAQSEDETDACSNEMPIEFNEDTSDLTNCSDRLRTLII